MFRHEKGLPGFDTLPEQRREICRIFYSAFSTEDGKKAFNILLNDLKYFHDVKTDGDRALSNYAKYLVRERMGISDTIDISDSLLKLSEYHKE